MIHLQRLLSAAQLDQKIIALKKPRAAQNWLQKAAPLSAKALRDDAFPGAEIWGEIKDVFIALQHYKCAYCESVIAKGKGHQMLFDVEHHRPKNALKPWTSSGGALGTKLGRRKGYPALAYLPANYVVACKQCNSTHKSNCFPILGRAGSKTADAAALNAAERPVVPLPFGAWGEDPEQILGWVGFACHAMAGARARGAALIAFFDLNQREYLMLGRATQIALLFPKLEDTRSRTKARRERGIEFVKVYTADDSAHAAACRSFQRLHASNRPQARQVSVICEDFIRSKDPQLARALLGP